MTMDISFVYSDGAKVDDPQLISYLNRDAVARWYNTLPTIAGEMDAVSYNIGLWCMEAQGMSRQRLEARRNMQANMRNM